jgi:hypothetical protein
MTFLYIIIAVFILFIFFKLYAKYLEDIEVQKFGGFKILLFEFFTKFEDVFDVIYLSENGASMRFQIPLEDTLYSVAYDLNYIQRNIFVKFQIYQSTLNGNKTVFSSSKLHFNNGIEQQEQMFDNLMLHLRKEIIRLDI